MKLNALAVGDLHLGGLKFLNGFIQDPDDYIYKSLDDVVVYAKEHSIKTVILLGDIFDNPYPSQEDHKRLFKYLLASGLDWYIISGNHDVDLEAGDNPVNSLLMPEFYTSEMKKSIHIYTKPRLIKIAGVRVCFLPWPHSQSLTKKPCLNVAHITLSKARSDAGRVLEGRKIRRNPNHYWTIGDLHTKQKYSDRVHYPGNLYQKTFGESLPKGFSHLIVKETGGELLVDDRWIPVEPPFSLVQLAIDSLEDLDKVEDLNRNKPTFYRLKVTSPEVVLPSKFRENHPHVLSVEYPRNRVKVEVEGKIVNIKGTQPPLKGLRARLETFGLSKRQINMAIRYSKRKLKELTSEKGD